MAEMTTLLLQVPPWVRTVLVVAFLSIVLVQLLRLAPPRRQRGDAIVDADELGALLGQTGRALTPMRPVGMCEFDKRRVECVAESGYVEKDKQIRVVRVEGTQLTVRVADET
jgi:membrane-bound ClpP family serine protease